MICDSFIYKHHFAHIAFTLECVGTALVVDKSSQEKEVSIQNAAEKVMAKRKLTKKSLKHSSL